MTILGRCPECFPSELKVMVGIVTMEDHIFSPPITIWARRGAVEVHNATGLQVGCGRLLLLVGQIG